MSLGFLVGVVLPVSAAEKTLQANNVFLATGEINDKAILNELNKKGTTIIYTSHHLSEAEEFCNRIVLIDGGKIIINGDLKTMMTAHRTDNLKELFLQFTGEEYRD